MKISFLKSHFVKVFFTFAVFGLSIFTSFLTVNGQTTTFAQFFERTGSQDFVFTNNTTSANFNAVSGGSAIFFLYQNISGLDPSLQPIQNAHLFVTTTTNLAASNNTGTLTQPLTQTVTVSIIRDTSAPVGVGSGARTNLLTIVFSPSTNTPGIVGAAGGNSATISATTPDHVVTFTSDFLGFGLTTQRNLAFSFSSVAPSLSLGSGNFLQSFAAAASGTFASNPVPVYAPPTAASVVVSGRVLSANGSGLRNAQVILTESNGATHRTNTGSFGNYEFGGIEAGQTVTVSVISRRYSFNTQVVSPQENVSDLNFYADF
jgi:hypothetical protein